MSLLSDIVGWNGRATPGNNLAVSYKTKHALTIWPHGYTLGHLSQRNKTYILTKTWTKMFTAFISVIAPKWKQPNVLLEGNG